MDCNKKTGLKIIHFLLGIVLMMFNLQAVAQTYSIQTKIDTSVYSNRYTDYTAIVTGYKYLGHHAAELGFCNLTIGVNGHHPSTQIYGGSLEFQFDSDPVLGLNQFYWFGGGSGGMNIGLNLCHYTNFKGYSFQFRPEIGIGFNIFRMVYGYSSPIIKANYDLPNFHSFSLNVMIPVKKLSETKETVRIIRESI